MIPLSELQLDALIEIFNVGAGRAAASLSEIVASEVQLSVPSIKLYRVSEINADILSLNGPRLGAVRQSFSGPFNADALLLFTEDRALEIAHDMMGSHVSVEEVAEFEQEAMCELGNIILNACLSSMADMLDLSLKSSLPAYSVGSVDAIMQPIVSKESEALVLVLHIELAIKKHQSQGSLIFLLSSSSLQQLLDLVDRFVASAQNRPQ